MESLNLFNDPNKVLLSTFYRGTEVKIFAQLVKAKG